MTHYWYILIAASCIAAFFQPWLLVATVSGVALLAQRERSKQHELAQAKAEYELAKRELVGAKTELRGAVERIEELQTQVDNVKAAQNMSFGRRQ
jgi:hypothetical protein